MSNLRKVLHHKLIRSSWLDDRSGGVPDLVEKDKAQCRQHPDQSAEYPKQTRVRAIEDQPGKIGANCK